jgi:RHS repeat-associated protein
MSEKYLPPAGQEKCFFLTSPFIEPGSSTWVQAFTYDAFGNINKTGNPGTSYSAAYSPVTNQVSGGPSYDANGNQLTSTPATLTWNALNLPISVNSTTATYDALGRMVEKGSGGTYTQFVFSPAGAILAVYSGGLVKGTIPLPGGGTAIYNGSGLNYIRHTDWLGSSRLATTWAHAVYSKEAYAPFGETYYEAGTADRSFTGQDQDVATGAGGTGVYDYLFRKYDPSAGRWLSPDPKGWGAVRQGQPQSLNRYAYVQNDPLKWVDHFGLCTTDTDDSVSSESDDGDDGDECGDSGLEVGSGGPELDSNNQTTFPNIPIVPVVQEILDKIASKLIPASPWKTVSGTITCLYAWAANVFQQVEQALEGSVPSGNASANMNSCMQGVENGMNPLQMSL